MFFVGDEFQSIYGFRHADLAVFRERREHSPQRLALTHNYRSRPEVLDAVNHLFSSAFGDDYQPLAASGESLTPFRPSGRAARHRQGGYKETGEALARGEARAIASRVRELVDAGRRAGRDRAPLRGRHRGGAVRAGAARAKGCRRTARPARAISASSRSSTCSCTCGSCRTAMTTRRSSRCSRRRSSACRTTRSR